MRVDVFKRTSEDWFPSYKMDGGRTSLVEVTFCRAGLAPPHDGSWRVCVWGEDDRGMHRDFHSEAEAWNCFLQIIGLDDVTRAELTGRGLLSA